MAGPLRRADLGHATKTILVPGGDDRLREFIASEAPMPVNVVSNPSAPLGPSDLAVLVVEGVEPALREVATRVLAEGVRYVVLVRRDVWSAGSDAVHGLLDEVQLDPRRKLIRFWRDRDELEQTLRDEVFTLDDYEFVSQSVRDGAFVPVGSTFEQSWELENSGFRTWEERALKELASEGMTPAISVAPLGKTKPGDRIHVAVSFTAPAEPRNCRSVWQIVDADGHVCFPWTTGIWCQVLAVY
ncbi:MAG: hypothetical protein QOE36_2608 [Gaiellaceae bacterium]|nr:hypothetical protein [Gaiellaceae bacterium]